jgi:hypothetical protein
MTSSPITNTESEGHAPHNKLYTVFCKCGWNMGVGEHMQPVEDFFFLLGGADKGCPICGGKTFIKNNVRAA